jgi:hypothetical protein
MIWTRAALASPLPVSHPSGETRYLDGKWAFVLVRRFGRDELYRLERGLETFCGYVEGDGPEGHGLALAQHRWLAQVPGLEEVATDGIRWNPDRGRWEALNAGQWQAIDLPRM